MGDKRRSFSQGIVIQVSDQDFNDGLRAAVDYRGDVSIHLKNGNFVEGFLFNCSNGSIDLFPKNSPQKKSLLIQEVVSIEFSGKDEALGKSWEDWVKRRQNRVHSDTHA